MGAGTVDVKEGRKGEQARDPPLLKAGKRIDWEKERQKRNGAEQKSKEIGGRFE